MKYLVLGFFSLAGLLFGYQTVMPMLAGSEPASEASSSLQLAEVMVEVTVPELSATAQAGQEAFETNCAACHGINAAGQDGVAPPLVHIIYEPNHHGDQSFYQAVRFGVRAHHWRFGNMPAIEGIGESEVGDIIAYVRALQRANGIF